MISVIRIAIVDDHQLFREGVTRSLLEIGGFEIVGEGATAQDAERIARSTKCSDLASIAPKARPSALT
jgi:DNA-binding NarL/FixJ family response regulator